MLLVRCNKHDIVTLQSGGVSSLQEVAPTHRGRPRSRLSSVDVAHVRTLVYLPYVVYKINLTDYDESLEEINL